MEKIRTHLLATAAVVALSSAAYAADMGMPLKAPPPAPPPIQDWSGVYVGLEGGYGWAKQNYDTAFDPFFGSKFGGGSIFPCKIFGPCTPDASISSVSQSGWLFGAHAGVQKQWGSWVLGLEASVDWADITGSTTATRSQVFNIDTDYDNDHTLTINQNHTINAKIDEIGMVGPKVGWAWSPNWMIYGIGGLAWAHVKDDFSAVQTAQFCNDGECGDAFNTLAETASGGTSMFGWAAGAGLDYKWQLDPGSAIVFGVQYMHYQFGNDTLVLSDNVFGTGLNVGLNTKESVDVVKGRISWLFSIH